MIKEWRNTLPEAGAGPWVLLTNGAVTDPCAQNAYDDRSWIENGLFRNSKQFRDLDALGSHRKTWPGCAHI